MIWSWSLFGAATFVACVAYGLIVPAALHASRLLDQLLPGFRWLTAGSFLLGLVETSRYGAYGGAVSTLIPDAVLRRSP